MAISEKQFEEDIERVLLAGGPDAEPGALAEPPVAPYGSQFVPGGYHRRASGDYDPNRCLIARDVVDFLYASQPQEWQKLKERHGQDTKDKFLRRLAREVARRGTLDVLRKGVKDSGCTFQLAYFRPASRLNPDHQRRHAANLFSVVRQLHYSARDAKPSLDLALFLNGLPLFTAEIKTQFTGQTVQDAIHQYRFERDPRDPLFAFGRCLAHFAIDPDLVYVATTLEGETTRFLPFNRGRDGGAGNPPVLDDYATSYLWREIWARDSVLNLVQHFIHAVEEEDERGRKTGAKRLIFPRYHQLDAVRRLVADARDHGTGQRYLIQHSAGSGKSNSIAWLAHQLSVLHDPEDRRVFDSIVVVTDRRVLDRQLQRTVRQFEQTRGVVENIDRHSSQLKDALERGKTIIVTTLQKFPVIVGEIGQLSGQRFAVIIDEAHSSQTGEASKSLKQVLATGSLEEAERLEGGEVEDLEDRIVAEMQSRAQPPNLSLFAFTATPKPKTLELFGHRRGDGGFEPFSLYSMRQAIEENFILDVLASYTTYKVYWKLLKTITEDPRYDRKRAAYLLRSFVDLHDHAIGKKVAIMVDHFADRVAQRIDGRAKAMIVCRSRLHAVRFKLAVDRYLEERGYPYKALVAFSGTVRDGAIEYTEPAMNGLPETQTAKTFERPEYRFLIVAEKFQTGFDQPFLHTMYVDKKLAGVHAVQTLSRLNRVHPDKQETMVLDFANDAEDIRLAFQPYYDRTILSEGTDPNLLYDHQRRLLDFHLFGEADLDAFARLYFAPRQEQGRLYAALKPVVDRFEELSEMEQGEFRGAVSDFVRLYAFLAQVLTFVDPDLEKLYVYARLLRRRLPQRGIDLPREIQEAIDIESYRIQRTGQAAINLARGAAQLDPRLEPEARTPTLAELEPLSKIIRDLNDRFGTDFADKDKVTILNLEQQLTTDPALVASVQANTPENARLTFDHVATDRLQDLAESNFKFYKRVTDDPEFSRYFLDRLFDRVVTSVTPAPRKG